MMEVATDALLDAGIPARAIQYERFDYAAGRGKLDKKRSRHCLAVLVALVPAIAAFALR